MFGRSQRPVFKPSVYRPGHRPWRMPRGLVLLLMGIALGAGGLLFLQTNYGQQRLTVQQSEQLYSELNAVKLERQHQQTQLEETTQQCDANKVMHDKLASDLTQAEQTIDTLRKELALFQEAMPPDPRGGAIGVRSARFNQLPGELYYQVLIMRDNAQGSPFQGHLQVTVEGRYGNGHIDTITSQPIAITLDRYDHTENSLPLPNGFQPRLVVIKVLDTAQKQQALRVYQLRS